MSDRRASGSRGERLRVWLGYILLCFIWGSTWLAIKVGLTSVPPFLGAAIRFSVASGVLAAIVGARKLPIPTDRPILWLYAVTGVLSFGFQYGLVYWGEQHITSGLSSILFAAYPFWVVIFSHLFLPGERLNLFKLLGISAGLGGLAIIFSGDLRWSGDLALYGMAATLLGTVLSGFSVVMVKKYGNEVDPFVLNLVGMLTGAIVLALLGSVFESWNSLVLDGAAIGSILYLSIVGSVVAFVTYYWLLKRMEAVYLSLVSLINPVVAVLLGAAVLGESLPAGVAAGAVLVLAGVVLAHGKNLHARLRRSP